jgi:hypothetical protein
MFHYKPPPFRCPCCGGMRLLDEAVETHDEEFLNDVYRDAKLLPCASYGTI